MHNVSKKFSMKFVLYICYICLDTLDMLHFNNYVVPSVLNGVCWQDVCSFIRPSGNKMYDYVL